MQTQTLAKEAAKIERAAPFFTIDKKVAKKTIEQLSGIVNTQTVLPILEWVYIKIDFLGVTFCVTDLEGFLTITPDIKTFGGEVSVCVYFNYLRWFINKSFEDEITIRFDSKKCFMCCGSLEIEVSTQTAAEFPKTPRLEPRRNFELGAKEFSGALSTAIRHLSKDDLRPSMTGVNICCVNKRLTIAATDAHRLYFKSLDVEADEVLNDILPRKCCSFISENFTKGKINLEIDANHIRIKTDELEFISRKIDLKYPDWQQVIPQTDVDILFSRKAVIKYLGIAKHFVFQSTRELIIEVSDKGLSLIIDNEMDGSKSEYLIEASFSKKFVPFGFGINIEFLLTAIAANQKSETVLLQHTCNRLKAMVFDHSILIMPLLLNR